jgi:indolepyruvate decarboxylase
MGFPSDYANMPVVGESGPVAEPTTDVLALEAAVTAIVGAVSQSKTACIIPGILVSRCGLGTQATAVIDASGLPFATMFMDKCVLDEAHPNYIGMYDGKLMNEQVRAFVEGCDCVLGIGAMMRISTPAPLRPKSIARKVSISCTIACAWAQPSTTKSA